MCICENCPKLSKPSGAGVYNGLLLQVSHTIHELNNSNLETYMVGKIISEPNYSHAKHLQKSD